MGPDTWELVDKMTPGYYDGVCSPGGRVTAGSAMPQSVLPGACCGGQLGCFPAFDHGVS